MKHQSVPINKPMCLCDQLFHYLVERNEAIMTLIEKEISGSEITTTIYDVVRMAFELHLMLLQQK